MAAPAKVLLVIMTFTYCQCSPGYRRDRIANEENSEIPTALINNQEEPIPDTKILAVDGSEAIIIEEPFTNDNKDVKAIRKLVQSKIRSQTDPADSNEEDPHLLSASIAPVIKSQESLDIRTKGKVISKKTPLNGDSNDHFKDIIKYFSGFMSSLLSANLTDVRIEEMKKNPEKEITNN